MPFSEPKMFKVRGVVGPVPEDIFLESLRSVAEKREPPELLRDGESVSGAPLASQTKVKLGREVHRVARRRGLHGQSGIDEQFRVDNNLPEVLIDPVTHKPLKFPSSPSLAPRIPGPADLTDPSPFQPPDAPPSRIYPTGSIMGSTSRPLSPEVMRPEPDQSVQEDALQEDASPELDLGPEFLSAPPVSFDGWRTLYKDVARIPVAPSHTHKDTGMRHTFNVFHVTAGVGVMYCHHLKIQFYLTEREGEEV